MDRKLGNRAERYHLMFAKTAAISPQTFHKNLIFVAHFLAEEKQYSMMCFIGRIAFLNEHTFGGKIFSSSI